MTYWFLRNAGANTLYPTSYTIVGLSPPPCPGANRYICAILAEDDGDNSPILTDDLREEMETAIANNTDQSRVLLRQTF